MTALLVILYFASTCLVLFVLVRAVRASALGILLVATMIWFLIGTCIYPLAYYLEIVQADVEVADFIARNGEPGIAAALHVFLAALGIFSGYLLRRRDKPEGRLLKAVAGTMLNANDAVVWGCSIALGVVAYVTYFNLVGVDVALMNAAAARGGDLEGFGEKDAFVFLKTVAAVGFVATCFAPVALFRKNWVFLVLYCLLIATAYANSISRNLLLYSAIVPVLVHLRMKMDLRQKKASVFSYVLGLALIPFALWVLTYGKVMGQVIRAYFSGDYYSMVDEVGDVNVIEVILRNFGFQWVSVQAGIDHFNDTGFPFFSREHVLATFFGAVPSRVLTFLGLDFLYYGNVDPMLACVNSAAFGYAECTVPPLTIGYSAYLLPGVGGFLMGFIWLRMFAAIERLWRSIQSRDWRKVWIPYFLWGTVVNFLTFIPSTIALATTQLIWVFILSRLLARTASSTVNLNAAAHAPLPRIASIK
ncbi:hypothetical protein [Noviherbaspirillum sp. ST9]|uniref:hypothetical protein n=1 Tax=Noviherbaspirillum sp. ST9 TaxID=3401606 RepID=UPI003B589A0E